MLEPFAGMFETDCSSKRKLPSEILRLFRPLGEASPPAGGWGLGHAPRHAQTKKIPAWRGFSRNGGTPLSLIHNVKHVLKHVFALGGFGLVQRFAKLADFLGGRVVVLG